ncbi:nuclear transport factor 2 family protein [Rhodococcus phenolicus]|uniref:nuclear transport factor 2 family protein n=1 Tax=Rhodococcus phenolicus TaxID=263849 RepID=UPI00082DD921|nr:nuclear transport factor 2 family protein [Rhodococcus phenolicus]
MNAPSELAARYAVAVDDRDAAALTDLFTADAEFVQPPAITRGAGEIVTVGAAAIAGVVLKSTAHLHGTRHEVHQQVVDIDGDTATGRVYCTAHHLYRGRDGMRNNALAVRYRDTYRLIDDQWLIARRELAVDYAEDIAVTVPSARPRG